MDPILTEDIKSFTLPEDLIDKLRSSTIVVTGSTGLIGSMFVRCVCSLDIGVRFILPVRNVRKAHSMFGEEMDFVKIVETDIGKFFSDADFRCDYIIHCASPTDGKYMSSYPVETYLLAVESTKEILSYALHNEVKGIVYVSSIEYYGQLLDAAPVAEDMMGFIDHFSSRSSYGLGKQSAEFLSFSYAREYGVPVKIARLTQTFGAGISGEDNRVFAQFARSVIDNRNIVLHTEGRSAKPYCYTTDAVSALLYILLKGERGEAYNVSTPGTYITIRQLAETFRKDFNPSISVVVNPGNQGGYAPETTVNLDSGKLMSLGWTPRHDLHDMLHRLLGYMRNLSDAGQTDINNKKKSI